MNLKEVKDLVRGVLRSDISEFELEHTGTKLKLRRGFRERSSELPAATTALIASAAPPGRSETTLIVATPPPTAPDLGTEAEDGAGGEIHWVTAPIVGTFYRSPSAGSAPYVNIGDMVEEGTILCVVEAMKLMNEIPSDRAGQVVRVYVENSNPVEFGQKLFGIRPRP